MKLFDVVCLVEHGYCDAACHIMKSHACDCEICADIFAFNIAYRANQRYCRLSRNVFSGYFTDFFDVGALFISSGIKRKQILGAVNSQSFKLLCSCLLYSGYGSNWCTHNSKIIARIQRGPQGSLQKNSKSTGGRAAQVLAAFHCLLFNFHKGIRSCIPCQLHLLCMQGNPYRCRLLSGTEYGRHFQPSCALLRC